MFFFTSKIFLFLVMADIFMLMEAMIDSGVHMGFLRETATTLVHHTLLGMNMNIEFNNIAM